MSDGTEVASCPWCDNEVRVERDAMLSGGITEWEGFHVKHRCVMFGRMVSRNYPTREECVRRWNGRNR